MAWPGLRRWREIAVVAGIGGDEAVDEFRADLVVLRR